MKDAMILALLALLGGLLIIIFIALESEKAKNEYLENINKGMHNELMAMHDDMNILPPPVI